MEQLIMNAIKNYGIEKAMGMFAKDDVDEAVEKMTGGGFGNSFINKFTGGQGLTGLFKNQAKKFGVNQGLKALTGGSGIAGALPLFGAALGLGYMTNPLREGSYNYNPNLQGQLDYASSMGNLNRNNSAGALRYAGDSILSGQNAISGFGTNDYGKQLQKYRDKYADTMPPERLEQLDREIFDQITSDFDEVDKFIEEQEETSTPVVTAPAPAPAPAYVPSPGDNGGGGNDGGGGSSQDNAGGGASANRGDAGSGWDSSPFAEGGITNINMKKGKLGETLRG